MDKIIYFDHAATSYPKPPSVYKAIERCMSEYGGNPGRSGHSLSVKAAREIYSCRESLCRLFNYDSPERIIFTQNATHALNLAIFGLVQNGHVLISNLEHNSVIRPVHLLYKAGKITYSYFDATDYDDEQTIFCFKSALRENTRLAVVTAASNVCGRLLPIEKISKICASRGIRLVVDAAQTGGVVPTDFSLLGCDALCLAGHKGLYGPQGTGVMILSKQAEPSPLLVGGNGIMSELPEMNGPLPERLEAGTVNTPGISGLRAGVEYCISYGVEEMFGKSLCLSRYLSEGLKSIEGVTVYGDYDIKAPVVLFNKRGYDSNELSSRLAQKGFCLRSGLHCAPKAHEALKTGGGAVRASLSHMNTRSQADAFLTAVLRA